MSTQRFENLLGGVMTGAGALASTGVSSAADATSTRQRRSAKIPGTSRCRRRAEYTIPQKIFGASELRRPPSVTCNRHGCPEVVLSRCFPGHPPIPGIEPRCHDVRSSGASYAVGTERGFKCECLVAMGPRLIVVIMGLRTATSFDVTGLRCCRRGEASAYSSCICWPRG